MTLLVCSKSTMKFLPYDRVMIISSPPDKNLLRLMDSEEDVVAIGGGAVLDTAKIISKNPITCYPTTAAGSSATSWAVYWEYGKKKSLDRQLPKHILFKPQFVESLPDKVRSSTICDALSHCLDSLSSQKITEESKARCENSLFFLNKSDNLSLLRAGHSAGKAIQITGTNLLHSLSYPITSKYGISHGEALGWLLPKLYPLMSSALSKEMLTLTKSLITKIPYSLEYCDIDIKYVITEAYKYSKMNECNLSFNQKTLTTMLSND